MTGTPTRSLLAAVLATVALAGCAARPDAPEPAVALGATGSGAERPIDGAAMVPGRTYHFADVLPGVLDVDLTAPQPSVFTYSGPSHAYLSGDSEGTTDVLTLVAADDIVMLEDPLHLPQVPGSAKAVDVGPDELLAKLSGLPFVEVTTPARAVAVGGQPGTAVDVRVPALPPGTEACAPGAPPCAGLIEGAGFGQSVVAGQELRFILVDHPAGPLLVIQNLQEPRAQPVLDGLRFVQRSLPAALASAEWLPHTAAELDPARTYGAILADAGVGAAFRTGPGATGYATDGKNLSLISTDLPPDLREPAPFGYVASTEKLFGYLAPSADLLVPRPGVDPRLIGPSAFDLSAPPAGGATGLVDLVAAQPWAEVVSPPAAATVGGLPGRSVDVRLRAGAGSVPCTLDEPGRGTCAVLVYSRSVPSIWLLSDRVLRVSEVAVGGTGVTVVSGTDDGGRAFSDSLRLVELER